jgi:hypothetical protein
MKGSLRILLAFGFSPWVSALAQSTNTAAQPAIPAIPAAPAFTLSSANNEQNTTYNPDPGASLKPIPAPFYQAPPGTPPDYGQEREPLLDQPHAPVLPIQHVTTTWKNRDYPEEQLPPGTFGVPDRWTMDIPVWMRYNTPEPESAYMYQTPRLWDPYKQSVLKGDVPIFGSQDIFLSLTGASFTSYEARDIPTPSGVSTNRGNSPEFYGEGDAQEVDEFVSLKVDLFKGETVFQPVTWDLHLEPVYNINYVRVRENGCLHQ